MRGVDATQAMVDKGQRRCRDEGLAERVEFTLAVVCSTGLPAGCVDFVWGEDAWCYVIDKPRLIAEAVRLVKPGGVIAFTDWIEGLVELSDEEAQRLLAFMKFPNIQDVPGYLELLAANGCDILVAEDTGRFAPHADLYLAMLNQQLAYDALKIFEFDTDLMQALAGEMVFLQQLARAGKIAQGIFIARKRANPTPANPPN